MKPDGRAKTVYALYYVLPLVLRIILRIDQFTLLGPPLFKNLDKLYQPTHTIMCKSV